MKHTPTPYEVYHESSETYVTLPAGKLKARAVCRVFHLDPEQRRVDAEFMVRACNNHDALVEAMRGMLREADRDTVPFIAARKLLKAITK